MIDGILLTLAVEAVIAYTAIAALAYGELKGQGSHLWVAGWTIAWPVTVACRLFKLLRRRHSTTSFDEVEQ